MLPSGTGARPFSECVCHATASDAECSRCSRFVVFIALQGFCDTQPLMSIQSPCEGKTFLLRCRAVWITFQCCVLQQGVIDIVFFEIAIEIRSVHSEQLGGLTNIPLSHFQGPLQDLQDKKIKKIIRASRVCGHHVPPPFLLHEAAIISLKITRWIVNEHF